MNEKIPGKHLVGTRLENGKHKQQDQEVFSGKCWDALKKGDSFSMIPTVFFLKGRIANAQND